MKFCNLSSIMQCDYTIILDFESAYEYLCRVYGLKSKLYNIGVIINFIEDNDLTNDVVWSSDGLIIKNYHYNDVMNFDVIKIYYNDTIYVNLAYEKLK